MAGIERVLLVYDEVDLPLTRVFHERLAAAIPLATLDVFPAESRDSTPSIMRELRARIAAAGALLCLLGPASARSLGLAWAVQIGLDSGKPVLCVRLHDSPVYDVAPHLARERDVPIINADVSSIAALLGWRAPGAATPPTATPLTSRLGRRR